ncbi:MAG: hypothetical protein ABS909_08095, partial [Arthrobacter sp.]
VLNAAGWLSAAWVAAALLGVGAFSGGTTSLVGAAVLIYGTGAALAVVGWLAWRAISLRVRRRADAAPARSAARELLAATASAREEFLQALFPAGATGTPEVRRALASTLSAAGTAPSSSLTAAPEGRSGVRTGPAAGKRAGKSPIRKNAVCKSAARRSGTGTSARPVQNDYARAA